jgi:murein DD-endopeptidase MepM/ murein hydrolase activator NlpD
MLLVLGLVNAYVFIWRDESALADLGQLSAAAIGGGGGPLPPLGDTPDGACGGDPVRVFDGLHDLVRLETSLSKGTTLRLALLHLGVLSDQIDRIESDVRSTVDLSLLGGSGAPVRVAMDRFGGVHALEIELAEGHVLQACRERPEETAFTVRNLQHPLRADVVVVGFELGRDAELRTAIEGVDEKPELADLVAEHLAHDVDFMNDARPGDTVQLMVEKRWLGRHFHRYGALMALRFRGQAARVAYFYYKPEGAAGGYFDREGRPMRRALLRTPVRYHAVNPEARALLEPSMEIAHGRLGSVYRLREGAPVVAIGDAQVREVGRTLEQGNYVDLELGDGTIARYAHLLRVIGELEPGMSVRQGQVVGLAGHTGRTPDDRLRLELWVEEGGEMSTIDPMRLTAKGAHRSLVVGESIPDAQRDRFLADTSPWMKALKLAQR